MILLRRVFFIIIINFVFAQSAFAYNTWFCLDEAQPRWWVSLFFPWYECTSNTKPTLKILAPISHASLNEGESLTFVAEASDKEDGNLTSSVRWSSSLDGSINATAVLSVGEHVVRAVVSDSKGATASATVAVTIIDVNEAPVVRILAPADGTEVEKGVSLMFSGEAIDDRDGDLSNDIVWHSSIDGEIADITTLSVGDHIITATVYDSQGLRGQAQQTIYVNDHYEEARSVSFKWQAPLYRQNGDPLYPEELGGYEIKITNKITGKISTINLNDGAANSYITDPLWPGDYVLSIRAYDIAGAYSQSAAQASFTL